MSKTKKSVRKKPRARLPEARPVLGSWRSASGESCGSVPRLDDVWVKHTNTDTDRLNWMIAHSAYLSHSRDGEVCNVWFAHDPADESNGAVPVEGYPQKTYYSAREAIDAAMAAQGNLPRK